MNGALIMLVGGGAMLAYLVYDYLQYKMRLRLRRESEEKGVRSRISYDWKVYAMIILTVALALLYARPITREIPEDVAGVAGLTATGNAIPVAVYVLVVGAWWTWRQAGKERVSGRRLVNDQVAELVPNFRSVFRIRPTVFSALEEANRKIPPPVGTAVAHAVTTFYVTSIPRRALDELRARVQNPYMEQFLYILERGEDAKHEDIMLALEGMMTRLRRARDIRDKSEVNMTVISGQTRIIQLIAITTVLIVAIIPAFRIAYEGTGGQIVFFVFASLGVVTSWYIDKRATELKERVL
jgi:hypothetical protein